MELLFAQLTGLLYPGSDQSANELLVTFVTTVIQPRLVELVPADAAPVEGLDACCDDDAMLGEDNQGAVADPLLFHATASTSVCRRDERLCSAKHPVSQQPSGLSFGT